MDFSRHTFRDGVVLKFKWIPQKSSSLISPQLLSPSVRHTPPCGAAASRSIRSPSYTTRPPTGAKPDPFRSGAHAPACAEALPGQHRGCDHRIEQQIHTRTIGAVLAPGTTAWRERGRSYLGTTRVNVESVSPSNHSLRLVSPPPRAMMWWVKRWIRSQGRRSVGRNHHWGARDYVIVARWLGWTRRV
jgi:hypothetical protein